jgi:SAM-dependent methyltransferase
MTGDGPAADEERLDARAQRAAVRDRYAEAAATGGDGCCGDGGATAGTDDDRARDPGYADEDLAAVDAADLALGCGNPTAIAALDAGEDVLDLGSGGGFDCFLAAREVGPSGRVVGVDMTPEIVERARANAADSDRSNVEFRLGEIEHLPVADAAVDAVISNCVLNLSPEKPQALGEAYRVLRPGGRLAVSDVVLTAELPPGVRGDPASVAGCIAGAATIADLETMLADAGFVDVAIEPEADSAAFIREWDADRDLSDYVVSAVIEARKPSEGAA